MASVHFVETWGDDCKNEHHGYRIFDDVMDWRFGSLERIILNNAMYYRMLCRVRVGSFVIDFEGCERNVYHSAR